MRVSEDCHCERYMIVTLRSGPIVTAKMSFTSAGTADIYRRTLCLAGWRS
jgi:hypothetical protein